MKKRTITTTAVATLLSLHVRSQATVNSLDDLFRMAEDKSQVIKVSRTAVESAEDAVVFAMSQRLPELGIEASVGYLGDGVLGDRSYKNWIHIDNPHFMNNAALKAQQVIYSGGRISSSIALARLGKELAELDMHHNREEVRILLTGQYLDLCRLLNQERVLDENLRLTEILIKQSKARTTSGTALTTDVTRFELQREEMQLLRQKIIDAQNIIKHDIAVTLHTPEIAFHCPEEHVEPPTVSLEEWLAMSTSSTTMKKSEVGVRMSEQTVRMKRSELFPKVAVVAENHFDGPITTEVPVIDKNINFWFAGVGVSYPLSSLWKGRKDVRKAAAGLRMSKERHVVAEENIGNAINASYTTLLTSRKEVETRQKDVQLADENYSVTNNRYRNGLCLLTEMLDASTTKLEADMALVNSRIDMLYYFYKLKYLTSTF